MSQESTKQVTHGTVGGTPVAVGPRSRGAYRRWSRNMKLVEFTQSEPGINKGEQRLVPDDVAARLAGEDRVIVRSDPRVPVVKPSKTVVRK